MHLGSNAAPVLCRDTGCPVSSLNSHLRDERRAQLAALLDASGTVLRLAAPVVDLLVRLSLSKAFFAPGMLPSNHLVEFVPTSHRMRLRRRWISENSKANRIETMKGPAESGEICSVEVEKIAKKIAKNKRCYANTLRPAQGCC
jgi:hypothetical protein